MLTADQLDKEPAAVMEASITEFYVIVTVCVPLTIVLTVILANLTIGLMPVIDGYANVVGLTFGLVGAVFTTYLALWAYSQIKKDKPYGYIGHRLKQTRIAKMLGLCPFIQPGTVLTQTRETL